MGITEHDVEQDIVPAVRTTCQLYPTMDSRIIFHEESVLVLFRYTDGRRLTALDGADIADTFSHELYFVTDVPNQNDWNTYRADYRDHRTASELAAGHRWGKEFGEQSSAVVQIVKTV